MVREPSPADEGSTARLLRLCAGYFVFYVLTGLSVKYFLGSAAAGFPGMSDLEYLVYSTAGGNIVCVGYAVARGWHRLESADRVTLAGRSVPRELLWIVPSGVCTAVVVPTTTLMYTLPVSVMVAMVIMRGAIIVISRLVDAIQIRQGILTRTVYGEENVAVVFAILAVAVHLGFERGGAGFDFVASPAALGILSAYIVAYAIRIYIMNYYKNTRPPGARLDNQGFFGVEQLAATATLLLIGALVLGSSSTLPQVGRGLRRRRVLLGVLVHVQGAHRDVRRAREPADLARRRDDLDAAVRARVRRQAAQGPGLGLARADPGRGRVPHPRGAAPRA
jgi:hypothetical protein